MQVERLLGVDLAGPELRDLRARHARSARRVAAAFALDHELLLGRQRRHAHGGAGRHRRHAVAPAERRRTGDGGMEERLVLGRDHRTLGTHSVIVYSPAVPSANKSFYLPASWLSVRPSRTSAWS